MSDSLPAFVIDELQGADEKRARKLIMRAVGKTNINYLNWFNKSLLIKGKTKRMERRIIAVTDYWVLTIGKRKTSIKTIVCRKGHIYFLKEIKRFDQFHSRIIFDDFHVDINSSESDEIVKKLLVRYRTISQGISKKSEIKFDFVKGELKDFDFQINSSDGGYLNSYYAWCSFYQVNPNSKLIKNVEKTLKKANSPIDRVTQRLIIQGWKANPQKKKSSDGDETNSKKKETNKDKDNKEEKETKENKKENKKKKKGKKEKEKGTKNPNSILPNQEMMRTSSFQNLEFDESLSRGSTEREIFPLILALQNNQHFIEFSLDKVKLKNIFSILGKALSTNNKLESVSIIRSESSDGLLMIASALIENKKTCLSHLNLSWSKMSSQSQNKKLFNSFAQMKNGFVSLQFEGCKLNSSSIVTLFASLYQNDKHTNLQFLNLSQNTFSKNSCLEMGKWIKATKKNNVIEEIRLSNCKIKFSLILRPIITYLSNKKLKILDLSENKITKSDLSIIHEFFSETKTLESINLSNTDLKPIWIEDIIGKIAENENLNNLILNLSANNFGAKGAYYLKKALLENKKSGIAELILDDCNFGDKGINLVCDVFENKNSIKRFSISRNITKGKFKKAKDGLSKLFNNDSGLKFLRIRGNVKYYLGKEMKQLFENLKENKKLISLDITGNRIQDEGFLYLLESINKDIFQSLYFDNNDLTIKSMQQFSEDLIENNTLFSIDWPKDDLKKVKSKISKKKRPPLIKQINELQKEIENKLNNNIKNQIPLQMSTDRIHTQNVKLKRQPTISQLIQSDSQDKLLTTREMDGRSEESNQNTSDVDSNLDDLFEDLVEDDQERVEEKEKKLKVEEKEKKREGKKVQESGKKIKKGKGKKKKKRKAKKKIEKEIDVSDSDSSDSDNNDSSDINSDDSDNNDDKKISSNNSNDSDDSFGDL
ncbi:leucine-rich repeat isoform f-related [Anaeramoeba flamelloides]|uniref:Leucine-rich repeat isoform f-related n=1 Tax=Anaeramoeba flamelloides TaxID=1746091 RepID=A0AAV8ACU9_9EUKA|nr:leucine-rich repeat isoform f-related [Anaeramoeba flamelloides]